MLIDLDACQLLFCYLCRQQRIFLVHLFEDGMLCAIHAKRVTLSEWDLMHLL